MTTFDKPDAARLDYANYHHGDPLDGQHCDAEMPKDAPEDLCLDQLGLVRQQMVQHVEGLMRGNAGSAAVVAYLQGVIRQCVKAGIAEWMEQENGPSSFRGDEAVIALLDMVLNTMVGDGGRVDMPARKVRMHAWAILYLLERTDKTQTQIAKENGYTKANVCAVIQDYKRKRTLAQDLRKTRGMKSEAAVEVYRERAKSVHKKKKQQQNTTWKTKSKFNSYWS